MAVPLLASLGRRVNGHSRPGDVGDQQGGADRRRTVDARFLLALDPDIAGGRARPEVDDGGGIEVNLDIVLSRRAVGRAAAEEERQERRRPDEEGEWFHGVGERANAT